MSDQQDKADRTLDELAAAAADRLEVDWTSARDSMTDPLHHRVVRELETIALLSKTLQQPVNEVAPAAPPQTHPLEPSAKPTQSPALSNSGGSWGPLRILAEIGRGSFGRVFRAWEPRLQREVALKLLDGVPATSEEAVIAEARLLAQIRHDNVVTVFGADCYDGKVGFWMEYIEGRTLWQMHNQYGVFGSQEALLVAVDLCHALAAVHRAGLVHGDVKAQNVMRQVGGRIVLADFGAARLPEAAALHRPLAIVTPYYAAPEVLLGVPPSVQSDLYSVGVLLYYLVTGQFPVSGRTIEEFRVAHASGRRTLLRDVRPDLPPSFIRVVDAATAALPEERPQSAGALEALIERVPGRLSMNGLWHRAADLSEGPETSIAVLPFVDLSKDQSLAYFCEGLAEEIIHALGGIPGLRVVPRASAFSMELRSTDAQQMGRFCR